jgi:hypothetical protein
MRSMFLAVAAALTLSAGVLAQSDLPKRMQDTRDILQFKDAAVPDMLKLLGGSVDVDVRYQVTGEPMKMPDVHFKDASVADIFVFLVRAADLKYTVIDDKTIVVTAAK